MFHEKVDEIVTFSKSREINHKKPSLSHVLRLQINSESPGLSHVL